MKLSRIVMAAGLFAALSAAAKADFVPVYDSSPPVGTPSDTYVYSLNFSTGADPGNGGGPNSNLTAGDFVTIYNFVGLTSLSQVNLTGLFTATIQPTGVTPPGITPSDDPTVNNLTITYTGPTLTVDTPFTDSLSISDPGYAGQATGQFSSITTKASGPDAGTLLATIGSVVVPRAVPEPASLMLMGLGLAGAAVYGRRRAVPHRLSHLGYGNRMNEALETTDFGRFKASFA